jgi:arsenite methyltransferase
MRFGYDRSNVDFRYGQIEDLQTAGIADDSVDVVISNCVINLSPDKRAVLSEIFRVLKPGGELYFADFFADRRVPDAVASDSLLYGECLGGAMYVAVPLALGVFSDDYAAAAADHRKEPGL